MIDFERVQVGAPEWDLAKVWDTTFPRTRLLDAVRLVCAWRGVAHAGRYGARALLALSERVTAALADELRGG